MTSPSAAPSSSSLNPILRNLSLSFIVTAPPSKYRTTMTSRNAGRQSPPPSEQTNAQVGKTADAHTEEGSKHAQESKLKSQQQRETVLESNPKGPLEEVAKGKLR
ncbi:hypothetical protein EX30DRAFT_395115 [Ascodesmis nigricans]|uniref:Uncharacterized protein n=1 Tax=Ascodesmis nigricans TaxID=341454 RepID=A0A4S2MZL6_9PEZI|nr:hypothetical protein EX30DRAFT_395115 [Ascodesmis nigricans]